MMRNTSAAFGELLNIIAIAKWHKGHCQDSECGVSLWMLGMTAKRLISHMWLSEKREARRLIQETNWS